MSPHLASIALLALALVSSGCSTVTRDADHDGFAASGVGGLDCDDQRASMNPMATDRPCNGLDDDCDGRVDETASAGECPGAQPNLRFADSTVVTIPASPAMNVSSGNFTFEAWIEADASQPTSPIFASKRAHASEGFAIGLCNRPSCTPGRLLVTLGEQTFTASRGADLRDNAWHHVAISRRGGALAFVVDGERLEAVDTGLVDAASSANLRIGRDVEGEESSFHGRIQDIRLWSVARSASQVRRTMGDTPATTGLVSRWPLSEGRGQRVSDVVGGNSGYLGSTPERDGADPAWGT